MIEMIRYVFHDFWETVGSSNLSWFPTLKGGPWAILCIIGCYLYFVTNLGPRLMKNREPFELRSILLVHNIIKIILYSIVLILGSWCIDGGSKATKCELFNFDGDDLKTRITISIGLEYYLLKYFDLMDTIYFVLKKKTSQVTSAHLIHHSLMPLLFYVAYKFCPSLHLGLIPIVNSFIHFLTATYHIICTIDPSRKHIYRNWARYLFHLQMIQFVFFIIIFLNMVYLMEDCPCSTLLASFSICVTTIFLVLNVVSWLKIGSLICVPNMHIDSQKEINKSKVN
ncbi:elongation of very long chain fatty acids protein 7-like [Panonychus citri]|uniref:elongation of very long chain fatty acids protein 7-like n=1 Tax=Panonychus citri TaxID=50023 RepID=UPI0023079A4D|nr:elongation of very long chain fatty acids protein 7-like [Panonychus citri]